MVGGSTEACSTVRVVRQLRVTESGAGEGEGSSATASDGAELPEDAVQGDC